MDQAENGVVGLKLAGLHQYDLIITDIVMPEHDGLEVISELRRRSPRVKILSMSGGMAKFAGSDILKISKHLGADRVLPKPLDFIMLQAIVKEMLKTPKYPTGNDATRCRKVIT